MPPVTVHFLQIDKPAPGRHVNVVAVHRKPGDLASEGVGPEFFHLSGRAEADVVPVNHSVATRDIEPVPVTRWRDMYGGTDVALALLFAVLDTDLPQQAVGAADVYLIPSGDGICEHQSRGGKSPISRPVFASIANTVPSAPDANRVLVVADSAPVAAVPSWPALSARR